MRRPDEWKGPYWEPRDIWMGVYWTRDTFLNTDQPLLDVYICLLPCFPIRVRWIGATSPWTVRPQPAQPGTGDGG